ncbi:MAG: ABC transporter permease [Micropepsaceae bacterium]
MSQQALSPRSYLKRQTDVIGALILRDLQTRFDRAAMYVIAVGWPMAHIAIIVTIYQIVGARVWLGTDPILFFALGVLPFILFTYPCRWVAQAIPENRILLNIPRVQTIDLILARVILECVTAFAVTFACVGTLILIGSQFQPYDPLDLIGGLAASLLFGVGTGIACSVLVAIKQRALIIVLLCNILLYTMSGLIFLPGNLPAELREGLAWNPLMHGVEWVREAYYGDYHSVVLDKSYLLSVGFVLLLGGLVAERMLRGRILRTA